MDDQLLPTGSLGYRFVDEKKSDLQERGQYSDIVLHAYKETFPAFNVGADPLGAIDILNQGNQGACQGHSLAQIFAICFFLATGRCEHFSRAAGYYLSQRFDGINVDQGSTLNGGRRVATEHGMCLEEDWPYPASYDRREPPNVPYVFKLKITKPFTKLKEVTDWIDAGLPVQTGFAWNNSCSREVVNDWRFGGGGHSTVFWQRAKSGNVVMVNSWGKTWNDDGCNEWTEGAISATLAHQWTTLVGYAPDGMSFPEQPPVEM